MWNSLFQELISVASKSVYHFVDFYLEVNTFHPLNPQDARYLNSLAKVLGMKFAFRLGNVFLVIFVAPKDLVPMHAT